MNNNRYEVAKIDLSNKKEILISFRKENGGIFTAKINNNSKNIKIWEQIIQMGEGTKIEGLKIKSSNSVDINSKPQIFIEK